MEELAFGLFGNFFRDRREKYAKLRESLQKAMIFVPVEKWLSKAVFYSIIAAFFVVMWYLLMKGILSLLIPELSIGLADFVLCIVFAAVSSSSTYVGFYMFPRIRAWERSGRIDMVLPYAIGYISAMASIGVIPYEIFKKLSTSEETYGEVSKDAKRVVRDVELLGADFITALKTLAARTPSVNMRAFVQGAVTTALSGGEMGSYFIAMAKEYMEDRRKRYEDFIGRLGLFAEFYVIGLVVAPLLLVVVFSIMTFLGGASPALLAAIVYLIIPLGSAAFIFLIGILSEE